MSPQFEAFVVFGVTTILVSLFAWIYLRDRQKRTGLWMLGWLAILVHFAALAFNGGDIGSLQLRSHVRSTLTESPSKGTQVKRKIRIYFSAKGTDNFQSVTDKIPLIGFFGRILFFVRQGDWPPNCALSVRSHPSLALFIRLFRRILMHTLAEGAAHGLGQENC